MADTDVDAITAEVDDKIAGLVEAAHLQKTYSTTEVAEFFDRSDNWVYWLLHKKILQKEDGTPIEPVAVGKRRRFTLQNIEETAECLFRRGTLDEEGLRSVLTKIVTERRG